MSFPTRTAAAVLTLATFAGVSGCASSEREPTSPPPTVAPGDALLSPFGALLEKRMVRAQPTTSGIRFAEASNQIDLGHRRDEAIHAVSELDSRRRLAIADCAIAAFSLNAAPNLNPDARLRADNLMRIAFKAYTEAEKQANRDARGFFTASAHCRDASRVLDSWQVPVGRTKNN